MMKEPANVQAAWQEDWASFTLNLALVFGVVILVVTAIAAFRRRRKNR
jgi:heme/copper-type cytochrome/quinol oxidase subunit 2